MKVKDFDLLLTCTEEVLSKMRDCGDHYEYTGSMNDIERLRDQVQNARYDYDVDRISKGKI